MCIIFFFILGEQEYHSNEVKLTILNGHKITRRLLITMTENKKESTHPPLKRYRYLKKP